MLYDNTDFRTTYNIDKEAHPDSEIIKFGGRDMTLGEIRDKYSAFDERRYKMLSFFDDVYQYTSLGLLDVLFDTFNIKANIPIAAFFDRDEIEGIDFVIKYMKEKYSIDESTIRSIERVRYGEILLRSPLSKNIESLFKMREVLDGQLIVFKYQFNGCTEFLENIAKQYGHNSFSPLVPDFLNGQTGKEYISKLDKSKEQYLDICACLDAQSILEHMQERSIENTIILTNVKHCGIPPEEQYLYSVEFEDVGPNNSRILYMVEEI